MRRSVLLLVLVFAASQLGCSTTRVAVGHDPAPESPRASENRHHGHGPPPHAPAHGYRHKHGGGVDLEYDEGLSAYVVAGYDDHFFVDDLFIRYRDGAWQVSVSIGDGWRAARRGEVPRKLRKLKESPGKGKSKGRGAGKKK